MRIAICDDEPRELFRFTSMLEEYRLSKHVQFTYVAEINAMDLIENMKEESFDIVFLDVVMPMFNGMQAAHEIRSFDDNVAIVFLTSSPEFAVESYEVNAYNYLLKPITKQVLFSLLDKIFYEEKIKQEYMTIKCKTAIVKVFFPKICYVEVMGKNLFFHMTNGIVHETTSPLSTFESQLLAHRNFMKVHRSFIVNLMEMREIRGSSFITFEGKRVPIARRTFANVKQAYVESLFSKDVF